MRKIAFIGNSHLACLKQAWNETSQDLAQDFEVTFFGANGRLLRDLKQVGEKISSDNIKIREYFKMTSGGQEDITLGQFDTFVLVGLELNIFQLLTLYSGYRAEKQVAETFRKPCFISNECFNLAAQRIFDKTSADHICNLLNSQEKKSVFIVPQPFPCSNIKLNQHHWRILLEKEHLRDLQGTYFDALTESFSGRAQVIEIPEILLDTPVTTHPKYLKGSTDLSLTQTNGNSDVLHMNKEYGRIILEKLFDQILPARTFHSPKIYSYIRQLDKPPIIIGGCARSGTTLLQAILSASPEVLSLAWETGAFLAGTNESTSFNFKRLYARMLEHPLKASHKRWAEKSPRNIYFFNDILHYFKEVKLIQIVRDGRDVILSRHPSNPTRYWVGPKRWINDVHCGVQYLDDDRIYTLRYEDLVLNFEQTLEPLAEYLEIPFDHHLKNWHKYAQMRTSGAWFNDRVEPLHAKSIGKWKHTENHVIVEKLLKFPTAVDLLQKYNYL